MTTTCLDAVPFLKNKDQIIEMVDNPQWIKRAETHDCRNHVPFEYREIWHKLDRSMRCGMVLLAMAAADSENWNKS